MTVPNQQRIRQLFHQAIQLPAEEREEFLKRECASDETSHRAVAHLLSYHRNSTILEKSKRTSELPAIPSGRETIHASTQPTKRLRFSNVIARMSGTSTRLSQYFATEIQRVWIFSIAGLLSILLAGYLVELTIRRILRANVAEAMQVLLSQQSYALQTWLDAEFRVCSSWARSEEIVHEIVEVDKLARRDASLKELSDAGTLLRERLDDLGSQETGFRYAAWNRELAQIADSDPTTELLGSSTTEYGSQILSRVLQGENVLWLPTTRGFITRGFTGPPNGQKPGLALIVPVYPIEPVSASASTTASDGQVKSGLPSTNSKPIAALLIAGISLHDRFDQMLLQARFGDAGEAYVVDENGFLVTESRFNDALQRAELIPSDPTSTSAQILRVAEPPKHIANLLPLDREKKSEWPLTKAARLVTEGTSGSDFDGYQDYRGVAVVGAWSWLEKFKIGIILEDDWEQAFAALAPLRNTYRALLGLMFLVGFLALLRWRSSLKEMTRFGNDSEIGPYKVEYKIGEGGMAEVYLATHSMLKRATALKLLRPSQSTELNLRRFEREVQLASRLTHANTIEIYDYGRTPSGEFFCAMEYVDGLTLQWLVDLDGAQKPARVVHILLGVCRSLNEAHQLGMIHRDVKPLNIMICRRGGEADFVKVLDFGLARDLEMESHKATDTRVLVGTPMFIAPERIANPKKADPLCDIFSIGVVAHILLTGVEPNSSSNSLDALLKTMRDDPVRPSETAPHIIPSELDELVWRCQARDPSARPQSVAEIIKQLEKLSHSIVWTSSEADSWWTSFDSVIGLAQRDSSAIS